jgi:hypothetical protein
LKLASPTDNRIKTEVDDPTFCNLRETIEFEKLALRSLYDQHTHMPLKHENHFKTKSGKTCPTVRYKYISKNS